ncbi:MAG TPA: hypothetical protein VK837_13585 [Longimicrobiales bacterium]|nr:hypothetical protein [Longimicrobiales bacterium]
MNRTSRSNRIPASWRPLAVGLLLLVTGCGGAGSPATPGGVDEDTFVGVYVELRRAAATAATDEDFVAERDRILAEFGVTEARLERFIDDHADDAAYLSDVWDRIDRTLRGELDAEGNPVEVGAPAAESDEGDS